MHMHLGSTNTGGLPKQILTHIELCEIMPLYHNTMKYKEEVVYLHKVFQAIVKTTVPMINARQIIKCSLRAIHSSIWVRGSGRTPAQAAKGLQRVASVFKWISLF